MCVELPEECLETQQIQHKALILLPGSDLQAPDRVTYTQYELPVRLK